MLDKLKPYWPYIGLILLIIIAFFPALNGGFVYDDDVFIAGNPQMKESWGFRSIWLSPGINTEYIPVTYTVFWTLWNLFGENGFPYHLFNLLIHGLNVFVLIAILKHFQFRWAYWVGFIFAIHPFNTDAVSYIFQLRTLFPFLFTALSFLLFLKFYQSKQLRQYALSVFCFLCALLSKISTIMFPVVLLVFLFTRREKPSRKIVFSLAPYFLLSAIFGPYTMHLVQRATRPEEVYVEGWAQKLALAGQNFWFYIGKTLWPHPLKLLYPPWSLETLNLFSFIGFAGMLLIPLAIFFFPKRLRRNALFSFSLYFLALFPMLGFFYNPIYELTYIFNHWHYIASPIAFLTLVFAVKVIYEKLSIPGKYIAIPFVFASFIWVPLTFARATYYKSMTTLMQKTLEDHPRAYPAYFNIGVVLHRNSHLIEAKNYYLKTLELKPNHENAAFYAGVIAQEQKLFDEARPLLKAAFHQNPNRSEVIYHYARQKFIDQDFEAAHRMLAALVKTDFETAGAYHMLAYILTTKRQIQQALPYYEKALQLDPDNTLIQRQMDQAKKLIQ